MECDKCARVVPVYAGRLVGKPGRPRFAMNKFWRGKCEDEQQEPLSHQQEEDEREDAWRKAAGSVKSRAGA